MVIDLSQSTWHLSRVRKWHARCAYSPLQVTDRSSLLIDEPLDSSQVSSSASFDSVDRGCLDGRANPDVSSQPSLTVESSRLKFGAFLCRFLLSELCLGCDPIMPRYLSYTLHQSDEPNPNFLVSGMQIKTRQVGKYSCSSQVSFFDRGLEDQRFGGQRNVSPSCMMARICF